MDQWEWIRSRANPLLYFVPNLSHFSQNEPFYRLKNLHNVNADTWGTPLNKVLWSFFGLERVQMPYTP